jgi:hypothetical protein
MRCNCVATAACVCKKALRKQTFPFKAEKQAIHASHFRKLHTHHEEGHLHQSQLYQMISRGLTSRGHQKEGVAEGKAWKMGVINATL